MALAFRHVYKDISTFRLYWWCSTNPTAVLDLVTPNLLKNPCCLFCSIGRVPRAIRHRDRGFHDYSGRNSGYTTPTPVASIFITFQLLKTWPKRMRNSIRPLLYLKYTTNCRAQCPSLLREQFETGIANEH